MLELPPGWGGGHLGAEVLFSLWGCRLNYREAGRAGKIGKKGGGRRILVRGCPPAHCESHRNTPVLPPRPAAVQVWACAHYTTVEGSSEGMDDSFLGGKIRRRDEQSRESPRSAVQSRSSAGQPRGIGQNTGLLAASVS